MSILRRVCDGMEGVSSNVLVFGYFSAKFFTLI